MFTYSFFSFSYVDKGSNHSPPSLSPTPPQRPISSSPPSSASRRRLTRVRKANLIPTSVDPDQRPQTAADFRDHVRHSSSDARLRSSPEERVNPRGQSTKEGPRGHSAPVKLSSLRYDILHQPSGTKSYFNVIFWSNKGRDVDINVIST